jgi:hypothetical protein
MRDTLKQSWKRVLYAGVVLATLIASTADWPRH